VVLPLAGVYKYKIIAYDINNVAAEGIPTVLREGPSVSTAPVLEWLGPEHVGYEYDGIEPHYGVAGARFTFKVRYSDIDGDPPGRRSPRVHLFVGGEDITPRGAGYPMRILPREGRDYRKGVIYYATIPLVYNGEYTYQIRAEDVNNVSATGPATIMMPGPSVEGRNVGPLLFWSDTEGYERSGVQPVIGEPTQVFVFEVIYKDFNNDPPMDGYPVVKLRRRGERTDIEYQMMPVGTRTYAQGMLYRAELTLSEGMYYYRFEAKDINGLPARGAPKGMRRGPYVAYAPSLSEGSCTPDSGIVGRTRFTFQVRYTDPGNKVPYPGYPKVHILCGGKEIPGSPFPMASRDRSRPDAGRLYTRVVALPYVSDAYTYYFEAKNYLKIPAIPTAEMPGPTVTGDRNYAPKMSWVGSDGYITDGVEPNVGTPGTNIVFSVRYTDPESQPPQTGYPKVYIYKDRNSIVGTYELVNIGTTTFAQGAVFATVQQINLNPGEYSYRFEAFDSNGRMANGIPSRRKSGLVITNAPVLSWIEKVGYGTNGVHPDTGIMKKTVFTYRVRYYDPDGDVPASGYPRLYITKLDGTPVPGSPFTMQFVSGSGAPYSGIYECGNITLDEKGWYKYRIEAYDRHMMVAAGEASNVELIGPIVTSEEAPQKDDSIKTVDVLDIIEAYNYPNPAYDGVTTLRCEFNGTVSDSAEIRMKVEIYDVAGDPVWMSEEWQVSEDKHAVEIVWKGVNEIGAEVANGVYIYRMIVENNGRRWVKIGKIAIIR
jgi:hypothetical protein